MTEKARALLAEGVGVALLAAIVVGSGIMGERLASGNAAIALLGNSLATGFGLFVLVLLFAPLSGAHLNPAVSLVEAIDGRLPARELVPRVAVQFAAALAGVVTAHAMFGVAWIEPSVRVRSGPSQALAEAIATAGLVLTIRGTARAGTIAVAASVAAWITCAYWFTASTSFANPALTFARAWTPSFSGLRPADVGPFVVAQIAGAVGGRVLANALFAPRRREAIPPQDAR